MADARALALSVLEKCEGGQYASLALDTVIKRNPFSPPDRALLSTLVYGVLERKLTLDHAIDRLSKNKKIEPAVREILRLGLYQLAYLERIPDHAAVSETVELAPARAKGFVNAILREFLRRGKEISLPDQTREPIAYLSVRYSVCQPLVKAFVADYGIERAERILAAFEEHPGLDLRVNTLKISTDDYQKLLAEHSIDSRRLACDGLSLAGSLPVSSIPGFDEGFSFVQDEASQLAVLALGARPGETILDACACPGSKAFGLAIDQKNTGRLVACDLHESKLSLVRVGAERLGISILTVEQKDAREERPEWLGFFDRVLCDVPCSGFGVLAKKPELRYKNPDDCSELPKIQGDILRRSAEFLKVGGSLLYSTCTLLTRENSDVVKAFLAEHKTFSLVEEKTLFPDTDHTDGFYFALLKKEA